MFSVWGRKVARRPLGFVADYCEICGEPKAFKLTRLDLVGHICYVRFGHGELMGYERTCTTCDTFFEANSAEYAGVSRISWPIEALLRKTRPRFEDVMEERRALEKRLGSDRHPLTQDERMARIKTPFVLLSPIVERRFSTTRLDMGILLAFAVAAGLCVAVAGIAEAFVPEATDWLFAFALAIGSGPIIWQFNASSSRYMRKEILPILVKLLAPLRPSQDEVERTLLEFKQAGHTIGNKLEASEVLQSMGLSP
ncbi:hypothetical protein AB4Z19_29670 [Pseudoduganella sp. RAF19]|uniref:hypothetical protein n=1 Tax=Pseudoduganella sp. RAF19 TaxID=3233052 RepID=UPI003F99CB10